MLESNNDYNYSLCQLRLPTNTQKQF